MSSDGFSNEQIIEFRKIINDHIKNARKNQDMINACYVAR